MTFRAGVIAVLLASLAVTSGCIGQKSSNPPSSAGWSIAAPESMGVDPDLLDELRVAARGGAFRNLHAVLVARHGKLIFEEYFGGFDAEAMQYVASVSKSVGSILLGIAMDQGLVPGLEDRVLDAPLADLLPEYADVLAKDSGKSSILFRHTLSMTAGLEWDETSLPYSDSRNDWIRASQSDDPVRYALSRPVVTRPGDEFNYHGVYSILPSYLVDRETGASAEAFAAEHLFGPLGIEQWEWDSLRCGLTDTDGGLHLRPRDMAKLGQLYLDGGIWGGRQVVSKAWVAESARRQIDNRDSPDYGLLWWCGGFHYGARSAYTFFASGHGGQRIHVFPEHGLVIVVTQQVFDNQLADLNNLAILSRYLLPAVDPGGRPEPMVDLAPEALVEYEGMYSGRGASIRIELRDGMLIAELEGAPPMRLEPLGGGRFRGTVQEMLDVLFAFELGAASRADAVRATWGFRDEAFRRTTP